MLHILFMLFICWCIDHKNGYKRFLPFVAVTSFPSPACCLLSLLAELVTLGKLTTATQHDNVPSKWKQNWWVLRNWNWRKSDTTMTNDVMFRLMMDRLDMQNTVFCSSGSEPFRQWEPFRTFERCLLRRYVTTKRSYKLSNHFKWIHIYSLRV